ncbi:MAG TPA: hypothetical protein VF773_10875 [Verrucomicrobiae bacterium]
MAKITGNIRAINTQAALAKLQVSPRTIPAVVGSSLVYPEDVFVTPDLLGEFQVDLMAGDYEFRVGRAAVLVSVPDDSNTYSIEQRIISVISPNTPLNGGAQPNATANVTGVVRTDDTVAVPIAVTGIFWKLSYAAVRAISNATNNKLAFVSGDEVFDWEPASLAVDNGTDSSHVLKPTATDPANPGRWIKRLEHAIVTNLAGLKALASRKSLKRAILHTPEPGVGKEYYFIFGDATAVDANDPYSCIAPDDNGGRFFFLN